MVHQKELKNWFDRRNKLTKEIPIAKEIDDIVLQAPQKHREKLRQTLEKYQWNFARNTSDNGLSQKLMGELKLTGDHASFSPPYPIKTELVEKIESKLCEMEENGIVEETCSAFNSPVLFIMKPNGSLRTVNNYSSGAETVNSRIVMPRYPTINVRVILQLVGNRISTLRKRRPEQPIVFGSIDLANALYVVGLRESSRPYTAFLYSRRQLQYSRLAQGLSSSPSIFAAFANKVFSDASSEEKGFFTMNYQDDLVLLCSEDAMIDAIDTVLKRCRDNNLVVRLSKCEFFRKNLQFLGYQLSENGITVPEKRIKILLNFPYPKTVTEAMRYQGAHMYYLRQTPELSALMSPLSREISKGKNYTLTDEIKIGIDKLRENIKNGLGTCHLEYNSNKANRHIFIRSSSC